MVDITVWVLFNKLQDLLALLSIIGLILGLIIVAMMIFENRKIRTSWRKY